jgi:uncharacterized protein
MQIIFKFLIIMLEKKSRFVRILSIDGGGIRGIIPGQVLVRLEEKLDSKKSGTRIADVFDLITGTSTGGILTCAYLLPESKDSEKPKFSAREVLDLYLRHGEKIFSLPVRRKFKTLFGFADEKYSAESLEKILHQYFGEVWLSELIKPCVITSYDIERRHGHFFLKHIAEENKGYDFKVKDVARSTSAAPTYFECAHIVSRMDVACALIDGGVAVNNPALCGYAEANEIYNVRAKDMVILSLGTGNVKKPYWYVKARKWGNIRWARPVIDIMMSGTAEVVHHQLHQIYSLDAIKDQYLRIDVDLHKQKVNPDMDCANEKNRNALAEIGNEAAVSFDTELDRIVNMLLI